MSTSYTPMLEQYLDIKSQHPNEILFFRLGDFYEMFFEDADLAARELEITLTSREGGGNARVPMCGIPYHAAETYIARLIAKGYKIAICEQLEDPKLVKGLVKREVIKVITPGTILSETLLTDTGNNFLALIYEEQEVLYLAVSDISTGECFWTGIGGSERLHSLCDQLFCAMPVELVVVGSIAHWSELNDFLSNRLPQCLSTTLVIDDYTAVRTLPGQHFSGADLPEDSAAVTAVGCLLHYLHQTVNSGIAHINRLNRYSSAEFLVLDASTLRNLEITRNLRDGGKKGTLLSVLDFSQTAMGGRLLKKWLEYPLIKPTEIIERQEAVAELLAKPTLRQGLRDRLSHIYDFERILTRVEVGTANARDLTALQSSLAVLPEIQRQSEELQAKLLRHAGLYMQVHADVVQLIRDAIVENPPFSVRDGGMIKPGYDLELDELRNISCDSKQWIQELETKERKATGIKSLKVGYNKVFGYYIEVTHTHSAAVPPAYIRKQTLANAERYITPELKEFETKVLGAQEKIVAIEYQLFSAVRAYVQAHMPEIQDTARQIARLDVIAGFSEAAAQYQYVRPTIHAKHDIIIKDGRHPVVERLLVRERFVPNDTELNHRDSEAVIITGPNMAGKSTYMRQVAILTLMAQIGSFIPAREAWIGPVDRIFTRVGASDDLATGQSTFMVEMNEVAQILKHATYNSLIILDEIGRGTSTFDGMSIARAVIEYIKEKIKAKTLFATHYHELTELADCCPGIRNYCVAVKERGNEVVFLRRIIAGGADKSYGIHVAQLAGLPKKTLERAQQILSELEQCHTIQTASKQSAATAPNTAVSLFSAPLVDEILAIDIMTLTPLEALNLVYKLQNQAKQEAGTL